MRHGSRRAKARRLQVHVAEALARAFDLSILAEKPTKPGKRNGVWWIGEGEMFPTQAAQELGLPGARGLTREEIDRVRPTVSGGCERLWSPDLRVRTMGQAGADVALLSPRARERVAYNGRPLMVECKNAEGWTLDAVFWRGAVPGLIRSGWQQVKKQCAASASRSGDGPVGVFRYLPLLVLGRNRWPPIAVADWLELDDYFGPQVRLGLGGGLSAVPFEALVARMQDKWEAGG